MPLFGRRNKGRKVSINLPIQRGGSVGGYPSGMVGDTFSPPDDDTWWSDRYSGGTSPSEQRSLYPVLGTAAGIHNLQVLQMMVAGIEAECYSEVMMPDGETDKKTLPLERLIECPLPWDDTQDFGFFSAQAMAAFVLEQELFVFKHLTRGGLVEGIEVLPNHHVRRLDWGSEVMFSVDSETLERSRVRSGYYTQDNILHVVYAPALGYARGLGAQAMARSAVLQGLMTDMFSVSYFKNALSLAGVMLLKGKTKEQIAEIEKDIAAKFGGVENAHKWMALNADHIQVEQLSATPSNANLVPAQQRAAIDTGKIIGVPPTMANESITGTLSYAIAAAQDVQITKNKIQPWAIRTAAGLNRKNRTPLFDFGTKMRYVLDDLLKGDERTRAEMVGKMVKNMLISINQGNRMMGYPTYEGEEFETPLKPTSWGNVDEEPPEPVMPPMPNGDGDDEEEDGNMPDEEQMSEMIASALSQIFAPTNGAVPHLSGV